jgi:two-component system, NarL family, nitrate/nitrite response regulator NarL
MRVLIVGSSLERARLRSRIDGSMAIAGEFASLAAARASDVEHDAIVIASEAESSAARPRSGQAAAFEEPLTPREVQVLELLAEGLPNKAIAERLAISDQTVKFHVSSISGKLGAVNRTDAVRRAVRLGLITL